MPKRSTAEEFIQRAKAIHGDKYDYSKVVYKNKDTAVKLICDVHGEFMQRPGRHLTGSGCKLCGYARSGDASRSTTEEFIEKAIVIHGDTYDYTKVEYVNNRTKVCVICKTHGEFFIAPDKHLRKRGCNKCGTERMAESHKHDIDIFIKKAEIIHNGVYDYSNTIYKGANNKLSIKCRKHGEFIQLASSHLQGHGCRKCIDDITGDRGRYDKNKFMELANKKHNNFYDYKLVKYVNSQTKVKITCPIHGVFSQMPYTHLSGASCPSCIVSSIGERYITNLLDNLGCYYVLQQKFKSCKRKRKLPFDFAVYYDKERTKLAFLIEYNGIQHFSSIDFFGGIKAFKYRIENDYIKFQFCKKNNIPLLTPNYKHTEEQIDQMIKEALCNHGLL